MEKHADLPKYNEPLNPLFQALHDQIIVNSGPDRFLQTYLFTMQDLTPNADQRAKKERGRLCYFK